MGRYRHSERRYRRSFGVYGDCAVGITPQMCKRVTNYGDMGTFSKPAWHSFRKCLRVSSAPDSHTGQSTTPPWNLWRQFNLRVLVLHLNRVIEPLSFEYKPSSPILFFALYISRVSLSSTSVPYLLSSHSFTLRFFFFFHFCQFFMAHSNCMYIPFHLLHPSTTTPPAPSSPPQPSAIHIL